MNIISAEQVKKEYKTLWPWMFPVQCMDQTYALESTENIMAIIDRCKRFRMIFFRDQIADCDNIALSLWAEFDEIWGRTAGYFLPCPFGRASGIRFNGENENHTLVTFLSSEGIYFYEPQIKTLWKADNKKDLIFLVQM